MQRRTQNEITNDQQTLAFHGLLTFHKASAITEGARVSLVEKTEVIVRGKADVVELCEIEAAPDRRAREIDGSVSSTTRAGIGGEVGVVKLASNLGMKLVKSVQSPLQEESNRADEGAMKVKMMGSG